MCLAVPIRINEINNAAMAKGTLQGVDVEFSVELLTDPEVGKYAVVHAGVAIELLNEKEALESISLIEEALGSGHD